MEGSHLELLALRIVVSVLGVVGNTILIVSILQAPRLKPFEVFLLGLAAANLEEVVVVDVYGVLLWRRISVWSCRGLKFLTILGEISSVLFTVLISIYRYQKLRGVRTRVDLSVCAAVFLSVLCGAVALLFSLPTLLINLDWSHLNSSSPGCPVDFFQCSLTRCPTRNRVYKYTFILVCNLLPLLVVTLTSCLIVRVLIIQQKRVRARQAPSTETSRRSSIQRSTRSVLMAMALFQLNWTVYLTLHLAFDPDSFALWSETEFFITTFYSAVSPYVYGLGNDLFSCKRFVSQASD